MQNLTVEQLVSPTPAASSDSPDPATLDLEQPATIMFTSGSSGEPKAVLHSYGNHYYNALGSNENIPLSPGDRWLLALPLWHVGGLGILFRTVLAGAAAVIGDSGSPLSEQIERHHITHLSLAATQLKRLLEQGLSEEATARLKAVLVGGSGVPEKLISLAIGRGWPICTTYGLTEMASQVTSTAPGDKKKPLTTSGRLLNHRELQLSTDGDILVRGQTLFNGYVTADDIDTARDDKGWFHTGDIGRLDDEGYLIVTGREDNMFVSGGENIYPEEIEQALRAHPGIEEAVVVPIPDDEFGQRPVAFIRFGRGDESGTTDLLAHLEASLPRFKLPVRMYRWPSDRPAHTLKPDRAAFAALAVQPQSKPLS